MSLASNVLCAVALAAAIYSVGQVMLCGLANWPRNRTLHRIVDAASDLADPIFRLLLGLGAITDALAGRHRLLELALGVFLAGWGIRIGYGMIRAGNLASWHTAIQSPTLSEALRPTQPPPSD